MAIIRKKIKASAFAKVLSGEKKSEFRLNDFEVNEGDTLHLVEVDNTTKEPTGRILEKKVTYVSRCDLKNTYYPLQDMIEKGILIISME